MTQSTMAGNNETTPLGRLLLMTTALFLAGGLLLLVKNAVSDFRLTTSRPVIVNIPPVPGEFIGAQLEAGDEIIVVANREIADSPQGTGRWTAKLRKPARYGRDHVIEEYAVQIAKLGKWCAPDAQECRLAITLKTVLDPTYVGITEVRIEEGPRVVLTVAIPPRGQLQNWFL